ncbi:sugar kinase [Tenuibacillus multivorans]|uniref:2-dehydro-3-deoxygluconokinase n=1 Tax=Tenuibacillus multivorans TaxID=237069 RepID=A0A1H0C1B7_9BACI|nr:sugar kinase [Tenuibacillus multivorans]GEL77727.1 2-keto-3-deoxygluconate kinase [Tenuibacillus multivorans]SDN51627.1 2-dehydro-3-deoxygluconokinase [Tenuibacillus multivorans]
MNQIDVFTLGETMVLFQPDQMSPLDSVHYFPKKIGGAESNVAIGLSRLGHSVGWFSKLGEDPFGSYIYKTIRGEGVDVSTCRFTSKAPTGLLFKEQLSPEDMNVYYYRNGSAASMMAPSELDETYLSRAKILHVTGITPALSETCFETVMKAIEIAEQHDMTIVFDPNLRLKLWSEERAKDVLNEIASHAHIMLPGLDEAQFMTGKESVEEVAESLSDGDKTVIVKLGPKGAYIHSGNEAYYVDGFPVERVVDPVGAGDGFAAGVMSGLLREESLETVVRRANAIGAMVVGMKGDIEGLPRMEEVNKYMAPSQDQRDVKR